jgi:uncharacterized protein
MFHNSFTAASALAFVERTLRGRNDVFFDLLQSSATNAAQAAIELLALMRAYPDGDAHAEQIRALESSGDEITRTIIRRLNREIAAPFEREDILELAGVLDDITDYIDEVADYLVLYRAEATMVQAEAMA